MNDRWLSFVSCGLWDLASISHDEAVDFIKGELGADGVCVPVISSAVCRLSARPDVLPRTFRCEAAAHFQPDARRYADTRLRPPTAAWIKSRNPLATLAEACAKRSLLLRLRVNACDNQTLVQRHAHVACKDAFGESSPMRMCPTNPDVRTYLRSVVDDLAAHYGPVAIDLCEADFGAATAFWNDRQAPAEPLDDGSLALCFCESCRQAAGESDIDAAALAAHVVESFDAGAGPDRHRMEPYQKFREKMVAELWRGIKPPAQTQLWWDCADSDSHRAMPAGSLDAQVAGQITPHDQPATVHMACQRIGLNFALGIDRSLEDGSSVVRDVSERTAQGHRLFIFDSFATMSTERYERVRQAVRFARRQA